MIIERFPEPIEALVVTDRFSEEDYGVLKFGAKVVVGTSGEVVWLDSDEEGLAESSLNEAAEGLVNSVDIFDAFPSLNKGYMVYQHINKIKSSVSLVTTADEGIRIDRSVFTFITFMGDNVDGSITLQLGADSAYELDISDAMSVVFPSSYYVKVDNRSDSPLYLITSYTYIEAP